jgi:hypothetical protein
MNANLSLLDLLGQGPDAVRAFTANTHLAACDETGLRLAVIQPAHPDWPNAAPEPGGATAYTLKIAQQFGQTLFSLPAASYSALRITSLVPILSLEIDADRRTVITNIQELSRLLSPWLVKTEAEKIAGFAALCGSYERSKPRPPRLSFQSRRLGVVKPEGGATEWTASSISVPFFEGRMIPVSLGSPGLSDAIGPEDADAIDVALDAILALGASEQAAAGVLVLAYCHDCLDAIGAEWPAARKMLAITNPAEIWSFVDNIQLHIRKDSRHGNPPIYVFVMAGCDWEEEHGLQLVYRGGNELIRVGQQDLTVT